VTTPAALVADLRGRGFVLEPRGERLHVEAPADGLLTPELLAELRARKAEILCLLQSEGKHLAATTDGWPPESLDAERRFGCWHARLYPFLGKTVSTPCGAGRLVQVFPERASVILPGEAQVGVFLPEDLWPLGAPRPAGPVYAERKH
jgi:hypothetical protein